MFQIRTLNIATDWVWVAATIRCHLVEDTCGYVATRDGKIVAAVIFDSFTGSACACHIAVLDPLVLRHKFLHIAARAAFKELGRTLVIGVTPSSNSKAVRFNERVGWREIYRVRDGHAVGDDMIVYEMRADSCPWYKQQE